MTGRLLNAVEEGLPPRRVVVWFAATLAFFIAFPWAVVRVTEWYVGEWLDPSLPQELGRLTLIYNFIMLLGLAGLAACRAAAFNPALDDPYRTWLLTTPWTADKPLPMGSSNLRWQDAALMMIAAYAWTFPPEEAPRVVVVLAFALVYSGHMAWALLRAGQLWSACGAAALAFALLLTIGKPQWQAAAVAIGLCVYCDWAFRRALRTFPWDQSWAWTRHDRHNDLPFHWPRLRDGGVDANEAIVPWRWVGGLSVLAGWGAATVADLAMLSQRAQQYPEELAKPTWKCLALLCFFAALFRCVCYLDGRSSPLGLWARLKLRRWIIPGHDYVYLAPLATLAVGGALPWALFRIGAPAPLTAFVTAAAVLMIAFGAPPTLAKWSLTGEYRRQIRRQGMRKDWVQVA